MLGPFSLRDRMAKWFKMSLNAIERKILVIRERLIIRFLLSSVRYSNKDEYMKIATLMLHGLPNSAIKDMLVTKSGTVSPFELRYISLD